MSNEKKDYTIENPNDLNDFEYSNTHKVSFSETELIIDFGLIVPDKEKTIQIKSRIGIPITNVTSLILNLFSAAQQYEKQYNKDIGFGIFSKENDELK